jgi:D-alanyl-D-alanine dipeptidase
MNFIQYGLLLIVFLSCSNASPKKKVHKVHSKAILQPQVISVPEDTAILAKMNLIDVQSLNPAILVDIKYATADNFMKMVLYERMKKAYLQKDVAERLSKVQDYLSKLHPGYHLLIYDALRPVSVQQKMWDALDSLPPARRAKFVSNPKNLSLHNLGAAVDITIVDDQLMPLDMGAGFDEIRQIAYPSMEKQFLAEGKLTESHIKNRDLLRKVMFSQGFRQLETEWWHFNACSRPEGVSKYKVLQTEP